MAPDYRWSVPHRRRTLVLRAVAGALLLCLLVFAGPTGYVLLASAGRAGSVAEVPAQPVAIVFGASVYSDGTPSPYLRARLDLAYDLYRAGKVRAVLVTGDNGTVSYDETSTMMAYLVAKGIPETKVVGDYAGFDTYDSCVRAKRIFGVDRAILTTQSYHLPRAIAVCRSVGVDAWGVGDDFAAPMDPDLWQSYSAREWLANLKAAWDLVSRREPTLGPHEAGIENALAAP
jgi:vancomycin permeability regulator SanA